MPQDRRVLTPPKHQLDYKQPFLINRLFHGSSILHFCSGECANRFTIKNYCLVIGYDRHIPSWEANGRQAVNPSNFLSHGSHLASQASC